MLTEMSVEEQYRQASSDDLRILVVGAGIGGITVAQLLRRQHRHPVLIDRAAPDADPGYMLALMPMVDPVLDRLGVHERYCTASTPVQRYGLRDRHGRRTRLDPIGTVLDQYGDYRGIDRASLIDALSTDGCPVAHRTTIHATRDEDVPDAPIMVGFGEPWRGGRERRRPAPAASRQAPAAWRETISGQQSAAPREYAFDVLILADGMGSQGRGLVVGSQPLDRAETDWSGWVVWIESDADADLGEEVWGTGFFLGSYPVLDRIGVFLGGPDRELDLGRQAFVDSVRRRLREVSPRTERALTAVEQTPDAYRWAMNDVRSPSWTRNRLALLGDAAAGFMPTAGIGAGMAMESAGVLAAALQRAERSTVAAALADYERVQRPRVEAAQKTSRQLARMMFNSSRVIAAARDLGTRFVDVGTALKPIQRLLQSPPADLSQPPSAVVGSGQGRSSQHGSGQAGGPSRSSGSLR
ncbi:FAD-dependent oxidoreductase [Microlunatus soli]|uniref:2-polyprenyl-6-methoxyphenol hydroxylase n=1 Tax=Microlunatus soli TaxID=630515 RepID=A0A1H1S2W7_9ACTN|nr:NAD(P)/FAD-dependent oxidoreductase [Microlunatus soli]SDS42367.1 2-polyprenyl-6-methoxyphenol hydroxylase [Microlunatus soli]